MDDFDHLFPEITPAPPQQPEPLPISALAQYTYCPRQAALILLEGEWEDNEFTLRGARAHENVDVPQGLLREGVWVERGLPLWSERLWLTGRADVVEFVEGRPYPVSTRWAQGGPASWPERPPRCSFVPRLCAWKRCSARA